MLFWKSKSIDRMYLNVIVGRLRILEGALRFSRQQRKAQVLSTNAVEPITRAFVESIEQFVRENQIPLITFEKGQRKDEVAATLRTKYPHREGVIFRRQGARKMYCLPHREKPQSQEKHRLRLDRQIYGAGEPLLFLLCRRKLRSFLPEVLFLLSLQCQVVPERA